MGNDVKISVGADTSAVNSGLNAASKAVDSFKNTTKSAFGELKGTIAGLFAVGSLNSFAPELLDQFGRIQDIADKFGESSVSIQRVGYAAKLSGSDIEAVAAAMQKVNGNALDAVKGNEALSDAFKAMGINVGSFIDLPMEEKLIALAEGFQAGGSNAEKLDALIAVLGKSGGDLIPLLGGGADALKDLFNQAAVAGDDSVAKLASAGDRIDVVFSNLKAYGAEALVFLIDNARQLWAALNSVGVFLANLPDGFKAASRAAVEFQNEFAASLKAEQEKASEPKKKTDVEKIKRDIEEREAAKLAAKEAADEKKRLDAEAIREKKEMEKQAAKEAAELAKRLAKEEADEKKRQLQEAKDAEKAGEENLKRAKEGPGISVDSLRRVGANLGRDEANNIRSQANQAARQVDLARQQLEQLKKAVIELEKQNAAPLSSGPTSFESV